MNRLSPPLRRRLDLCRVAVYAHVNTRAFESFPYPYPQATMPRQQRGQYHAGIRHMMLMLSVPRFLLIVGLLLAPLPSLASPFGYIPLDEHVEPLPHGTVAVF